MRYFSMFSGIGGFELGIGKLGTCVGYSEIDKYAIKVYEGQFNGHTNYGAEGLKTLEIMSDTQRYKMCGNAVTVNTVKAVMEGLYNGGCFSHTTTNNNR